MHTTHSFCMNAHGTTTRTATLSHDPSTKKQSTRLSFSSKQIQASFESARQRLTMNDRKKSYESYPGGQSSRSASFDSGGSPFGSDESRCRVYSCSGSSKILAVSPCSTIFPCCITQQRSAMRRTMPRSWVMNSMERPFFSFSSASNSRIWA